MSIHELGDVLPLTSREVRASFAPLAGVPVDRVALQARLRGMAAKSLGASTGWRFDPEHFRVELDDAPGGVVGAVTRWDPGLTRAGVVCGGPVDGWEFVGPEPAHADLAVGESGPGSVMLRVAPVLVARVDGCRVVSVRLGRGREAVGVGEVRLEVSGWSDVSGRWTYAVCT